MAQPTAVVITGATGGIGRATVERFEANDTYEYLALFDIDPAVTDVATEYDGGVGFEVDVADGEAVQAAVDEIEAAANIQAAVNLAAVFGTKGQRVHEISDADWDRLLSVNLQGQFNVAKAVSIPMVERGRGYLVNVSSMAGRRGSSVSGVHYSASKSGIFGLTRGLAKELCPEVRVNCVTPGLIETPPVTNLWTREELDGYTRAIPLGRMGKPAEIARLLEFLSGPGAGYITGEVIDADGGAKLT